MLHIKFIIITKVILIWDLPHSRYTQKLSKLEPPPALYAIICIWLDTPHYAHIRSIYSGSSFPPSQFIGYFHFLLASEVKSP